MIDSETLDAWERRALVNGSLNEDKIPDDRILQLCRYLKHSLAELRRLQERESAFREALDFIRLDAGTAISNASHPFDYKLKRIYEASKEVLQRYPEEGK